MSLAVQAVQNLAAADAAIRRGLRGENPASELVRHCYLTEEQIVGLGDGGVISHYYYTPTEILIDTTRHYIVASIPGQIQPNGCLRMYLILSSIDAPVIWANLQLAQIDVNLDLNSFTIVTFPGGHNIIRLRDMSHVGLSSIITDGYRTLTNIAISKQDVW